MVSCIHLTIPQVTHTYTELGSGPCWNWNFEMFLLFEKVIFLNKNIRFLKECRLQDSRLDAIIIAIKHGASP